MALRVLLADESSTIKKVIQLALQDYAVEVKSVPIGLDVLPVAKVFKPDLVLADVLLTKRSGYEVCQDLKQDPETAQIPVILMWSGFMEIDAHKADECQSDGRLEKPFDADQLRNLVQSLVPRTKANIISEYLTFPDLPEFDEAAHQAPVAPNAAMEIPTISLDEMDSDEDFAQVPLTSPDPQNLDDADDGGWAQQDLKKFKIPMVESEDFAKKFVIPEDELTKARIEVSGDFEEISFNEAEEAEISRPAPPPTHKPQIHEQKMDFDQDLVEKVLRQEARQVIESICWKILPEIAEKIVREEINKILRESEKSI